MDPIADMITIIRNGYLAYKGDVLVPYSKFKEQIAHVLAKENFIAGIKKDGENIKIDLLYEGGKPKIKEIKKVSKLGLRVYSKSKKLGEVKGGRGIYIVTTPKGVMSSKEAKTKKLGGEIICLVW